MKSADCLAIFFSHGLFQRQQVFNGDTGDAVSLNACEGSRASGDLLPHPSDADSGPPRFRTSRDHIHWARPQKPTSCRQRPAPASGSNGEGHEVFADRLSLRWL